MRDDTIDFLIDLLDNLARNKEYDTISGILYSVYDMIEREIIKSDKEDWILTLLVNTLAVKNKVTNRHLLLAFLPDNLKYGLE